MPSSRRASRSQGTKLNLIPILDAIFIFIFFLLISASFINIFEINSSKPIISTRPPKKFEKPLGLTLRIDSKSIKVMTGIPSRTSYTIERKDDGEFDLLKLHDIAIELKRKFPHESTVIMEPIVDLEYEQIIKIIDSVRATNTTDVEIYIKGEDGLDQKLNLLFDQVVFGNVLS